MQTFLPFEDFSECARVLDNKRLWKQVLEARQISDTLSGNSEGWKNHPAVKMWGGHEYWLRKYATAIFREWMKRRIGTNFLLVDLFNSYCEYPEPIKPTWLGNKELHKSHRLNLLYKHPEHYSKYFKEKIPITKPEYFWIIPKENQ